MLAVVGRRLLAVVPMVFVVSLVTFGLVSLIPGDIAALVAGEGASPEAIDRVRTDLGLNDPLLTRYASWVGDLLTGDLGRSLNSQQPVSELLIQRIPTTLSLTVMAIVLGVLIGAPLGILAGVSRRPAVDRAVGAFVGISIASPSFVLALLLAAVFALQLGWFPTIGYVPLSDSPSEWLRHMILPSLALSFTPAAVVARQLRGAMRTALDSDYIRTARAKGLRRNRIIVRHALRNSLIPPLSALGSYVAVLLSGTVAVELVFGMPGLGLMAVQAVGVRDLTVIQGVVLAATLCVIAINLVVDLIQTSLSPRARR